jgi:hypothetical protein
MSLKWQRRWERKTESASERARTLSARTGLRRAYYVPPTCGGQVLETCTTCRCAPGRAAVRNTKRRKKNWEEKRHVRAGRQQGGIHAVPAAMAATSTINAVIVFGDANVSRGSTHVGGTGYGYLVGLPHSYLGCVWCEKRPNIELEDLRTFAKATVKERVARPPWAERECDHWQRKWRTSAMRPFPRRQSVLREGTSGGLGISYGGQEACTR